MFRACMVTLFGPYFTRGWFHIHRILFQVATRPTSGAIDFSVDPRADQLISWRLKRWPFKSQAVESRDATHAREYISVQFHKFYNRTWALVSVRHSVRIPNANEKNSRSRFTRMRYLEIESSRFLSYSNKRFWFQLINSYLTQRVYLSCHG